MKVTVPRVTIAAALSLLSAVEASSAETGPARTYEATASILGVRAGSAETLSDVAKRLGSAEIWHTGDASESESKLCYRISSEKGETVLVFSSNGEMSEPKGQVTGIQLYSTTTPFRDRRRCSPLKAGKLTTPNGLGLGSSPEEVTGVLGKRGLSKRDALHYTSCRKQYMRKGEPYFERWFGKEGCFENPRKPYTNECSYIEFQFKEGAAAYMNLSRNQSVC